MHHRLPLAALAFAAPALASPLLLQCSSSSGGGGSADSGKVDTGSADSGGPVDSGAPVDSGTTVEAAATVMVAPNGNTVFMPDPVTVHAGDTVRWVWMSSGHTVTSGTSANWDGKFCSPDDMNCNAHITSTAGSSYEHTFVEAGAYPYFCFPHYLAGMVGTVNVQ